ncbi:MAG: RES family NAD+ phosphorylase [Alphaproteobacteria bacterium]|nr:RES family NAD+ phosphorylase [Alphaproteobacteria bacterium]
MTDEADLDEIRNRSLCATCIGEQFLRTEIERNYETGKCFYCGKQGKIISIEEMAHRIETAFDQHYYRTSSEPSSLEYTMIKEGMMDWDRNGEPVIYAISSAAEIEEEPAKDIQQVLEDRHADFESATMGEECPFDSESHYEEKTPDDIEFRSDWAAFERDIKKETRYFNKAAEAILEKVFEELTDLQTRDGQKVIISAGLGAEISSFYRARIFQSDEELEEAIKRPDIEIGPPPFKQAMAGRMNAYGISVFYGATTPEVALAEVRPPVGSRVIVGRFDLVRPIRLLNIDALRSVYVDGSIFDAGYIYRLERAKFLEYLSQKIVMPVMPNDEPIDYLVTQAIADYLATKELDGVIYPSAQASDGKKNVVLFHHAARVKQMDIPTGTKLSARLYDMTEDGPEIDYWVWEETPPLEPPTPKSPNDAFPEPVFWGTPDSQARDNEAAPTLCLDATSLKVHHISHVHVISTEYSVQRHRSEMRDWKF